MSSLSAGKGLTSEANMPTPAIGGSIVEVGAHHDGFYDPLATDTVEAQCGVGDSGRAL